MLLAHHLLAHGWALARDIDRMFATWRRLDVSPLGAGALAGSSLGIDPDLVADELGFDSRFENSLDAVSDRDFVAETLFDLALLAIHLSRIGEEIVLFSSEEFGFVRLDDAWATGSSMLPQKKNPDVAELARGKAGRLVGHLAGFLTTLKGLPLAYNRDLQEDKEPLFDALDQVVLALAGLEGLIGTAVFDLDRMQAAADGPGLVAVDLAEWLVGAGMPFRDAHGLVATSCASRWRAACRSASSSRPIPPSAQRRSSSWTRAPRSGAARRRAGPDPTPSPSSSSAFGTASPTTPSGWPSGRNDRRRPRPVAFRARRPKRLRRSFLGRDPCWSHRSCWASSCSEAQLVARIVEVEAYRGADDAASHAFRGKDETERDDVRPAWAPYVYFTYGMHYCANVVCWPEGEAGAVLLRALAPLAGLEEMAERRSLQRSGPQAPGEQRLGVARQSPPRPASRRTIASRRVGHAGGGSLLGAGQALPGASRSIAPPTDTTWSAGMRASSCSTTGRPRRRALGRDEDRARQELRDPRRALAMVGARRAECVGTPGGPLAWLVQRSPSRSRLVLPVAQVVQDGFRQEFPELDMGVHRATLKSRSERG